MERGAGEDFVNAVLCFAEDAAEGATAEVAVGNDALWVIGNAFL